jgi:hypothetical protein
MIEMFNPQRSEVGENQSRKPRKLSGKGPDESSPVRSAGLAYFKRRPSRRDDGWLLVLLKSPRDQEPECFDRPLPRKPSLLAERTSLFCIISQHFVLGYFHKVPSRTSLQRILLSPYVDPHGKPSDPALRARQRFSFRMKAAAKKKKIGGDNLISSYSH